VGALAGFLWLLRSPIPYLRTLEQIADIARLEAADLRDRAPA
jgi:hypothetical protein